MPGILGRWRAFFNPTIVQYSIGPDASSSVLNMTARDLYNSQDNLAAVVNFLANSIAQLPLKVYKRKGETDRVRDRTSPAALLIYRPNPDQTEFEFIRALMIEYFVFGCVYVWKIPDPESESGYQVRIIPTDWIVTSEKKSSYAPDKITVASRDGTEVVEIPRTEFVRFCTYSPGNPAGYVSPISALRQTLEEQIQAGRFRRDLWKSSGRLNAQIIRPKDVAQWTDATRERWIKAFREAWSAGGAKAGSIPLMEDGMEIKPFQTSFKEHQWYESVKLSREAVAAAYRINPSLVWHTDTQTYASAKENARALYAECLGPDLQMVQQRINSFLLPMIGAEPGTYVEFDLTEKLKGSFEDRANILQASVGGPWLTRNEARADNNLPPIEGGDKLIVPLNIAEEGETAEVPEEEQPEEETQKASNPVREMMFKAAKRKKIKASPTEEEMKQLQSALSDFFERQAKSVLPKIGAKSAEWWDAKRWNRELAEDLEPILKEIAAAHGQTMMEAMGGEFKPEAIVNYVRKIAVSRARMINNQTVKKIQEAIEQAEDEEEGGGRRAAAEHEFDIRKGAEAFWAGAMLAKKMSGFGTREAVAQARLQGIKRTVWKVWETGGNARSSHEAMDGERVEIDDLFSNGADWPGDDTLDPDESCGCNCSTSIVIE